MLEREPKHSDLKACFRIWEGKTMKNNYFLDLTYDYFHFSMIQSSKTIFIFFGDYILFISMSNSKLYVKDVISPLNS